MPQSMNDTTLCHNTTYNVIQSLCIICAVRYLALYTLYYILYTVRYLAKQLFISTCSHQKFVNYMRISFLSAQYVFMMDGYYYFILGTVIVTLNGFCPLSKHPPPPHPLFLTDNIKINSIPNQEYQRAQLFNILDQTE